MFPVAAIFAANIFEIAKLSMAKARTLPHSDYTEKVLRGQHFLVIRVMEVQMIYQYYNIGKEDPIAYPLPDTGLDNLLEDLEKIFK